MAIYLTGNLLKALMSIEGPTCVMSVTNGWPGAIIKAPRLDAESMSKKGVIIAVTPALCLAKTAAVFRFEIEFMDRPDHPMILDTFLNPNAEHDLLLLRRLAVPGFFNFYLFDMGLNPVGQKRIAWRQPVATDMRNLIPRALAHNAGFPYGQYDYAQALADLKEAKPL